MPGWGYLAHQSIGNTQKKKKKKEREIKKMLSIRAHLKESTRCVWKEYFDKLPGSFLGSITWLPNFLLGEGNGNPLHYSCLENPMDRGVWWAIVHGVARVRHDLATKPPPPPNFPLRLVGSVGSRALVLLMELCEKITEIFLLIFLPCNFKEMFLK